MKHYRLENINITYINRDISLPNVMAYSKKYRIISTLYQHLMKKIRNTFHVKLKWKYGLGVNITEDEWLNIWRTQLPKPPHKLGLNKCYQILYYSPNQKQMSVNCQTMLEEMRGNKCKPLPCIQAISENPKSFLGNVHTTIRQSYSHAFMFLYFGNMTGNAVLREQKYLLKLCQKNRLLPSFL